MSSRELSRLREEIEALTLERDEAVRALGDVLIPNHELHEQMTRANRAAVRMALAQGDPLYGLRRA